MTKHEQDIVRSYVNYFFSIRKKHVAIFGEPWPIYHLSQWDNWRIVDFYGPMCQSVSQMASVFSFVLKKQYAADIRTGYVFFSALEPIFRASLKSALEEIEHQNRADDDGLRAYIKGVHESMIQKPVLEVKSDGLLELIRDTIEKNTIQGAEQSALNLIPAYKREIISNL